MAYGMPRLDLLHGAGDLAAYCGGFWGLARIGPRAGRRDHRAGRARGERRASTPSWRGSRSLHAEAAAGRAAGSRSAWPPSSRRSSRSERQIESIRAQTAHETGSASSATTALARSGSRRCERVLGGDPRFVALALARRLGFYRNFERALTLAPAGARVTSRWPTRTTPGTRTSSRRSWRARDAQLVYSDAADRRPDGELIADTYWERARATTTRTCCSLLVANSVTGAASLFPARCSTTRCRSRPAQFTHFHDHWLALTRARARRHRLRRPARSTTTCSTATRRSGTRPPTG